ncbi:MAG: quinolinate synthase [Parcubacteria group bacterium Gr01-1014_20]|nr:MAG: quinolinate synthase [Parcubacteria group bacterium Gr01-1014_20]
MTTRELAARRYEMFNRLAGDLYPGRYTEESCLVLAELEIEIRRLAEEKHSLIVAHNYLLPEVQEAADKVGDSLGLSFHVRDSGAERVDFESVFFMGATAKIIAGDKTRVFVPDKPEVISCSLVLGTDYEVLHAWKRANPDGLLVTYINSDAYTKSISDFITTSRNTDKIIAHALREYPGRKILVLPDKYLGFVMKIRALRILKNQGIKVDPDLIEIYTHEKFPFHASCYVHEKIGEMGLEVALSKHPEAEVMIHPECGCASSCLMKLEAGIVPRDRFYFLSTEQMVEQAKESPAEEFIVATEMGMIYRLRKEVPEKRFLPVSNGAVCDFMKECTLPKLARSLRENRLEIILCDDCCDPQSPYQDESVVHIQKSVAEKAKLGIERMLSIQ